LNRSFYKLELALPVPTYESVFKRYFFGVWTAASICLINGIEPWFHLSLLIFFSSEWRAWLQPLYQ
jgi:hypothetical protein